MGMDIGILPEDHHPQAVQRAQRKTGKQLFPWRIHRRVCIGVLHKCHQFSIIGSCLLLLKKIFPAFHLHSPLSSRFSQRTHLYKYSTK